MRKILFFVAVGLVAGIVTSCKDSDNENVWDKYAEWRDTNDAWIESQAELTAPDGSLYYTKVVPAWNKTAYVLVHYFNDRSLTEGNLSPLYTSTVDVKYIGRLYNDEPFDSSFNMVNTYGDSIYRAQLCDLVPGWAIAMEDMRVGDSCRVVVPYEQGYYSTSMGSIPPYSCLQFDIKLVDIPYYEIKNPE